MKLFLREEVDTVIDKVEEEDDRCADTDKVGVKKCKPSNDLQKGV